MAPSKIWFLRNPEVFPLKFGLLRQIIRGNMKKHRSRVSITDDTLEEDLLHLEEDVDDGEESELI